MSTLAQSIKDGAKRTGGVVCVGLDPVREKLPEFVPGIAEFNSCIVEATTEVVAAYKLQLAFYEAEGIPGLKAMEKTIACVRDKAPDALLIADAKRADVEHVSRAYAKAFFETWDFDVVTLAPYMGRDAIKPFLRYPGKGVFICARTSNPSAAELQDQQVEIGDGDSQPLYELVARQAYELQDEYGPNVGIVVGATYPEQLLGLRNEYLDLPFLIPGIGAQGGDHTATAQASWNADGEAIALVSVSRSVLYASSGADFADAARKSCLELRSKLVADLVSA